MKIDAHHHFWNYSEEDYGWIDDEMATIRRSFGPDQLRETSAAAGIDRVVSVQARQSLEETDWLLGMAEQEDFIAGVVGWLPLVAADCSELVSAYSQRKKLKGLRHVLQGESDPEFMLREDFNRGLATLVQNQLSYDILIFERQLPQVLQLVDRHPNQRFILDHCAKPRVKEGILHPWQSLLSELSKRENVWCKLSGLVTEAEYSTWTAETLRPYMDGVLEAFGSKRLMFGSDWPVCLVAAPYEKWVTVVSEYIQKLSTSEQDDFWQANACRAYQL